MALQGNERSIDAVALLDAHINAKHSEHKGGEHQQEEGHNHRVAQKKADVGLNDLIVAEIFQGVIEKNREHGDQSSDREHRAAGEEQRKFQLLLRIDKQASQSAFVWIAMSLQTDHGVNSPSSISLWTMLR